MKNKVLLTLVMIFTVFNSFSIAKPAYLPNPNPFMPSSTYYLASDFSGQPYPQISDFSPCVDLKYNLKPGDRDYKIFGPVTILQTFLYQNEYMIYPPTGNFFDYTFQGVLAFQQQHELRPTGVVDSNTRLLLKEETCNTSVNTPIVPVVVPTQPTYYCSLNGQSYQSLAQLNSSCNTNNDSTFYCPLNNQYYESKAQLDSDCVAGDVNTYYIEYSPNGASGSPSIAYQNVNSGSSINLATQNTMVKSGYTFTGWSTSPSGINSVPAGSLYTPQMDITLYAVWDPTVIIVGHNTASSSSVTKVTNVIRVTEPYQGLKFYSDFPVDSNITISYSYEACLPNGYFCKSLIGESVILKDNTYSSAVLSSDPDNEEVNSIGITNISPASDSRYIYSCNPVTNALSSCSFSSNYTVIYNPNSADSGTPAISNQSVTAGTSLILTTQGSLTRNGYRFDGWSTSPSGSNRISAGTTYVPSSNITFYAAWTPVSSLSNKLSISLLDVSGSFYISAASAVTSNLAVNYSYLFCTSISNCSIRTGQTTINVGDVNSATIFSNGTPYNSITLKNQLITSVTPSQDSNYGYTY